MGCLRRGPHCVPAPQLDRPRIFRSLVYRGWGGWRITVAVAESTPERVRNVRAQRDRVLLELVLSAIVLGEPAVGLRADLAWLSLPPGCPSPPIGAIEHSVLGLRSGR